MLNHLGIDIATLGEIILCYFPLKEGDKKHEY